MSDDNDEQTIARHDRELAACKQLASRLADVDEDEDIDLFEMVDRAIDRVEELEARVAELDAVQDMLNDVASEKTSKEQKVGSVVAYADNARSSGDEAVTVLIKNVKGAAGVSRRYAYDLIDNMIDEYDWAHDPGEISQYGSFEKDSPQRGVVIDFEGVHGEPVDVNKFTTRLPAQEVSD